MLRPIIVAIVACCMGSLAHADEPADAPAVLAARRSPAVVMFGEVHREAWNYNLSDEDLFGGSAGLWYPVGRRWSIRGEMPVLWVHQERVPSTPLGGVTAGVQRHFQRGKLSYFAEGALGVSYAARFVPARGTRFNYIIELGTGVVHPTSRYAHLVASFRFLHVSNKGLAGRDRNPDIEAFGLRLGVVLPLFP